MKVDEMTLNLKVDEMTLKIVVGIWEPMIFTVNLLRPFW